VINSSWLPLTRTTLTWMNTQSPLSYRYTLPISYLLLFAFDPYLICYNKILRNRSWHIKYYFSKIKYIITSCVGLRLILINSSSQKNQSSCMVPSFSLSLWCESNCLFFWVQSNCLF